VRIKLRYVVPPVRMLPAIAHFSHAGLAEPAATGKRPSTASPTQTIHDGRPGRAA